MSDTPPGGGPNRTVFRPSPLQGLNRPAGEGGPPQAPPHPQTGGPAAPLPVSDDVPVAPEGRAPRNLMMTAAAPFLALIAGVRAGRVKINLPQLHGQVTALITRFDSVIHGRYTDEEIKRAKYALAATADDVALNLPGMEADGAEWARRSIVVRFFNENIGGDRFWRLLDEMVATPAQYLDLIELYHGCMAAGFEGRYRVLENGRREHLGVMQRAFQSLEHPRGLSNLELVPRWRGSPTPMGRLSFWTPMILAAAAASVLLLLIYIVLRVILAQTGAPAMAALKAVNPDQPMRLSRVAPPAPTPPAGAQLMRLKTFLAPEIAQHLVVVIEDATTTRVRTTVGQLFHPGSDQLDEISTVTFPDNMALSKARAETVAALIRKPLSHPERVTTEGYGDASPIASNDTAAGKTQNRRVEVVLQKGT